MKAIVVEINGKQAIAMNNNGEFLKIKNTGRLNVGYEVEIPSKVIDFNFRHISKVASVAALLIVVLGLSIGAYSYYTPFS